MFCFPYIFSIFIRALFLCLQNWTLKFHGKSKQQSQQTLGFSYPYIGCSRFQRFQNQRKYIMKGIFHCKPQKYVLSQVWSFSHYDPLDFTSQQMANNILWFSKNLKIISLCRTCITTLKSFLYEHCGLVKT